MEASLVRGACGFVHRLQESPIRVHAEGVEPTSADMVGVVEGL